MTRPMWVGVWVVVGTCMWVVIGMVVYVVVT